ncbi:MAG: hypothetical protein HYW86_02935 [Candidatus Roizmanbacteria bacterium]|nr:MAG: hypothetical protein HYW86_02935 [Candidatus Roizmanbacteria bacterium]
MKPEILRIIDKIREEKDYLQKARQILYLNKQKDISIKDIAGSLSLKSSYVCHILRLNRLPELIVDGYYAKLVTLTHLFILSRLKETKKMLEAYEKVLIDNLTVGQTEFLIRDIIYDIKSTGARISSDEIKDLNTLLTQGKKNLSVKLIQSRIKSKLILEIKGSLLTTSEALRNLIGRLKSDK